ncbi:MAG TPA: hypothetical protein VN684_11645 [Terriglobales bacterium]|nr:hypothetical protein [Terriglobales bacterium]
MKFSRSVRFAFVFLMFGIVLAASARADQWNKKTIVTLTQPLEVPGNMTLPAGKYVFKLHDSMADRRIVQIWNGDETKLLTTILAIPNYRLEPTGETVITFRERPGTEPQALRSWFYPGDSFGQEFAYPKARAVMLAEASNEVVPAEIAEAPTPEELRSVPLVAVTPSQKEEPIEQALQIAPVPEKAAVPPTVMAKATQLPKTASPIPLIGLIGLICLGLGFGLKLLAGQKS